MTEKWPFKESRKSAALTTVEVLDGLSPIMYVSHDEDDGCWQFYGKSGADESQAKVVPLEEIFLLDPSISALSDLPRGWRAERETVDEKWERMKSE